jgi:hypothetical protein
MLRIHHSRLGVLGVLVVLARRQPRAAALRLPCRWPTPLLFALPRNGHAPPPMETAGFAVMADLHHAQKGILKNDCFPMTGIVYYRSDGNGTKIFTFGDPAFSGQAARKGFHWLVGGPRPPRPPRPPGDGMSALARHAIGPCEANVDRHWPVRSPQALPGREALSQAPPGCPGGLGGPGPGTRHAQRLRAFPATGPCLSMRRQDGGVPSQEISSASPAAGTRTAGASARHQTEITKVPYGGNR